jgi:hypothetical protein
MAREHRKLTSSINILRVFTDGIRKYGMKFGLEKCARLVVERGKVKYTE